MRLTRWDHSVSHQRLASAALLILLQAALLCWIFLTPFAWILIDGMGSDSVKSHGLDAVVRALTNFYWGPILLALFTASWPARPVTAA